MRASRRKSHAAPATPSATLSGSMSAAAPVVPHAAHRAVQPQTVNMTRDFAAVDGSEGLADVHENYVIAVVKSLLDRAATDGDIRDVDTAAIAQVLGRLGRAFARTDLAGKTRGNPEDSANAVADVILAGLVAS